MSDTSQGPGWWIASDDKWYPPHLHPSVRVPEPWETQNEAVAESSEPTAQPVASGTPSISSTPSVTADEGPPASTPGTPAFDMSALDTTSPETLSPDTLSPDSTAPGVTDSEGSGGGSRRRRKGSRTPVAAGVSIFVVILLIIGAFVVFGGSESASAKVINAVNSTLNNGTAHVTLNLSGTADGTDVTGTGSGDIDFVNNALSLQMTVGAGGQQVPVSAVYLGGVVYETIPGLSTIAPGKSWLSIDLSSLQKAEEQDPSTQELGDNPSVMLQMLAQQGNTVVALGPSVLDGVAVNGYSVTVNPSSVAQQLKKANLPSWMQQAVAGLKVHNIGLKVYVDNSGLLRSFEIHETDSSSSTGPVTIDETMGFSNYGTPVNVTAPPTSEVESFQQLLQIAGSQGSTTQ